MKPIFKQSFVMSAGTIINSLLGLVFYIIIARFLGPSEFGNFSFLLGFGLLAAEAGDLGLGSAMIKFGSGPEFRGVFTLIFGQRVMAAIVFFFIAFLVGGNFYLSAFAATSLQLVSLITQTFLARQKYGLFVITNIFGNLCRLGLVWLFASGLNFQNTLQIFFGANFFAFFLGLVLILNLKPFSLSQARNVFKPVWQFSRFVAISYGVSSIGAKLDVPIIFLLAGSSAAGIYSSAQKLISIFSQIASSIEAVFAPKFSSDKKISIKDYVTITIFVAMGLLILPLFSGFFINLIFGQKYFNAVPVFNLMSLALIPFFFTGPFSAAVLYRFGKSNYHLIVSVGQLIIGLLGYWLLVPSLGASGAAVSSLFINLFGLIAYVTLYKKISK